MKMAIDQDINYEAKKQQLKQKYENGEITQQDFANQYGALIVMQSLKVRMIKERLYDINL